VGYLSPQSRILVPVNGSRNSRNAAEIAFVLARATGARVTVLYVSLGGRTEPTTRQSEESVLKDLIDLADRYSAAVSSRIAHRAAAADAILSEARDLSMMVMGVSIRPGEQLFFGNTAAAILAEWRNPVLFVSS
jgi:nucleotide-binding universal stress UspA family protein